MTGWNHSFAADTAGVEDRLTPQSPAEPPGEAALREHSTRLRRIQLGLLLLATFTLTTGSTFVDVVVGGRLAPKDGLTGGVVSTHLGSEVGTFSKYAFIGLVLLILVVNARIHHTNTPALVAYLLMIVSIQVINRIDLGGSHFSSRYWVMILLGLALWSIGLKWNDLEVIGYAVGALAIGTLLMALLSSHAWMISSPVTIADTKALLGQRILAGPFGQMNNLGISMAAGFPFVLLIRRRGRRQVFIVATLLTCILSASRTSLIAVAATVFTLLLLLIAKTFRRRRKLAIVELLALVSVMVWIPLNTTDPHRFTSRGEIWMKSISIWKSTWDTGSSTFAYVGDGAVARLLGASSYHGHNLFISAMTMGGVLFLLCAIPLTVALVRRVFLVLPDSIAPLLFVVIILSMSITEMPLRFDNFEGASWITWVALLAIVLFDRNQSSVGTTDRDELSSSRNLPAPRPDVQRLGPRW